MKNGVVYSVLDHFYHRNLYEAYAKAGALLAGIYVIRPSNSIAYWQRHVTMKAHTHRTKAEKALT